MAIASSFFCENVQLLILVLSVIQAVADIIRTTLGPRSMLKMLLDASGGNAIYFRFLLSFYSP